MSYRCEHGKDSDICVQCFEETHIPDKLLNDMSEPKDLEEQFQKVELANNNPPQSELVKSVELLKQAMVNTGDIAYYRNAFIALESASSLAIKCMEQAEQRIKYIEKELSRLRAINDEFRHDFKFIRKPLD